MARREASVSSSPPAGALAVAWVAGGAVLAAMAALAGAVA
jgi:hypothetical protein